MSRPILVTGMPRSGTTWLARLLATASGTALAGREPMNPRARQYALAGTLHGWAKLTSLTPRQQRALRLAYRGWNPFVFSRYGRRQWAAPLPGTRLVMKDPFAMLSVPVVAATTGAIPVLLYRHPGAALASYRRMGWAPDLGELAPILDEHRAARAVTARPLPGPDKVGEAEAMGQFWSALYEIAIDNAEQSADLIVVSHEELASGGVAATGRLFDALALTWREGTDLELSRESRAPQSGSSRTLHNFDRAPSEVAGGWRRELTPDELRAIEAATTSIRARLQALRLVLA